MSETTTFSRSDAQGPALLSEIDRHLTGLVRRVTPAIVSIDIPRARRRPASKASGVVVAPSAVLTNAHVVASITEVRLQFSDGWRCTSPVIGRDLGSDLALLQVPAICEDVAEWGDSDALLAGSLVVSIANPLGLANSVGVGHLSAQNRRFRVGRSQVMDGVLQTDAASAPGSSGGGLFDRCGRLVGITVANNVRYSGFSFAVTQATASWVAGALAREGRVRRAHLGARLRVGRIPFDHPLADTLTEGHRLYVAGVNAGSAADAAGLTEGDWLIDADGQDLFGFYSIYRSIWPGRRTALRVLRANAVRDLEIEARERAE